MYPALSPASVHSWWKTDIVIITVEITLHVCIVVTELESVKIIFDMGSLCTSSMQELSVVSIVNHHSSTQGININVLLGEYGTNRCTKISANGKRGKLDNC